MIGSPKASGDLGSPPVQRNGSSRALTLGGSHRSVERDMPAGEMHKSQSLSQIYYHRSRTDSLSGSLRGRTPSSDHDETASINSNQQEQLIWVSSYRVEGFLRGALSLSALNYTEWLQIEYGYSQACSRVAAMPCP